jgi:hypothetical protein
LTGKHATLAQTGERLEDVEAQRALQPVDEEEIT